VPLVIDALATAPTKRRMQRWLETNPFARGGCSSGGPG